MENPKNWKRDFLRGKRNFPKNEKAFFFRKKVFRKKEKEFSAKKTRGGDEGAMLGIGGGCRGRCGKIVWGRAVTGGSKIIRDRVWETRYVSLAMSKTTQAKSVVLSLYQILVTLRGASNDLHVLRANLDSQKDRILVANYESAEAGNKHAVRLVLAAIKNEGWEIAVGWGGSEELRPLPLGRGGVTQPSKGAVLDQVADEPGRCRGEAVEADGWGAR